MRRRIEIGGVARPGFLPLLAETRTHATAVFLLEIPAVLALVACTVLVGLPALSSRNEQAWLGRQGPNPAPQLCQPIETTGLSAATCTLSVTLEGPTARSHYPIGAFGTSRIGFRNSRAMAIHWRSSPLRSISRYSGQTWRKRFPGAIAAGAAGRPSIRFSNSGCWFSRR